LIQNVKELDIVLGMVGVREILNAKGMRRKEVIVHILNLVLVQVMNSVKDREDVQNKVSVKETVNVLTLV
jgi:hypothetical protein